MTLARRWQPITVAALAALAVAAVGGTMTELGPWYRALRQPPWAPPDWLYGVAWTAIYAFAALAGLAAWRAARRDRDREAIVGLFALNGILNIGWSLLFFRIQRPDWALVEVALLWLSIVVLIWRLGRISRPAALLLLPYLAWVSVAAALNVAVVRLNSPFG